MRQAERTGRGALVVVIGGNPLGGGPPLFDMTRMRRHVGGIFVCAAAAVAAALGGHLLLLGTFPTAWFATDRNPEMPPKEAISMDQLDPEQIAGLLKRGGELIAAGDVSLARLVLKRAAEAGNASAALELGATYDPFLIKELTIPTPLERGARLIGGAPRDASDEAVSLRWWGSPGWLAFSGMDVSVSDLSVAPDIEMAGSWYQKAKDLGSAEAQGRLDGLAGRER